jgi:transcriptional regulator with XRE-family HTH domain
MTQDGLAVVVGVSRSAVAQWETGRAGQLNANLARVAEALGVPVNWLMYGDAPHAALNAATGDELALLNLYRTLQAEDRQILLQTARRLARRLSG